LRTLDRYLFFSYLGPFILTLFISLFVLVMQFLWLYIDDLVGKGLELKVVAEIFYYVILTLVPMALPLAILLSSIMTFGSLGEHYELAALKAAGYSLPRIMKPLIIFSVFLSVSAFFFSNNVLPYATLKWRSMIFDVTRQKPAITITEGVFYTGINKYVIRVEKKDPDGKTLRDIMIYDHSAGLGNTRVVIAESGYMEMSEDLKYFIISLRNGHSYDEIADKENGAYHPLIRSTFKEQIMKINLSGFEYNRTDEELFKSNFEMMNLSQILTENDTLQKEKKERVEGLFKFMTRHAYNKLPVVPVNPQPVDPKIKEPPSPLGGKKPEIKSTVHEVSKRANVMNMALTLARSAKMEAQRCA
jgi:lipopolysaccharide export system permease protein